ncbi:MAG: protein kinase, partial [Polyangiaceae bacterium]|nr:protein kinase [Polyangiaceae bacterium]
GRYRDAGRAYEAALRSDPEAYAAALSLGRILARMGRYEQATRALQVAARGEHERSDAERWLIACFDALSMREAAAARLEALRRVDPETPPTVEALLLEAFGDVRGLDALRSEEAEASLLAGRYRPTRTLGEGSTGRVLEAEDTLHARSVAIKVLTVGGGMGGRDAHARFAREARIAAALSHPNLVEVYDFVAAGPFLVMELMPGGTLEERLLTAEEAGRTLSVDLARSVANAVLAGLEAVHRRGVIHRDLKPTNVFFGATGDVKLGDFGTAHLRDLGATMTGALQGTLAYMAPEQITAGERPSAATDLYAFGVLLFRMLTGALPLKGPDFVAQHLEREPPRVSTVRPALGRGFDDLVARLLAKDPAARPRSAAEVRAALEAMPWHALDEESEAAARTPEPIVRPVSETPIAPYIDTSRYELRETLPDGAKRVRDCLLERSVLAVPIDAASREHYRACARADGPHLQAVYGFIDDFVLLEDPAGAPCAGEVMPEEGLRAALEALEREGV